MRKGLITDLLISCVMAALINLVYTECTRVESLILFNTFFLTFRIFGLEDRNNDK